MLPDQVSQLTQQLSIFGKTLHKDIASAIKCSFGIRNARVRIDIAFGRSFRFQGRVAIQGVSQRLQTRLPGNLGLGAALGLVGQIKIFKAVLGICTQALFKRTQLAVIQRARHFFAVPGNKRNGGTFVQQGDGGINLLLTYAEFVSYAPGDTVHATSV